MSSSLADNDPLCSTASSQNELSAVGGNSVQCDNGVLQLKQC